VIVADAHAAASGIPMCRPCVQDSLTAANYC
jgi:hypothetical protein